MKVYKAKGQERYFLIDDQEAIELEEMPTIKDRTSTPVIRTTKRRKKYEMTHGKPVEPTEKRPRGRRRKVETSYECSDCTAVFQSKDELLDAVCPGCYSRHIKKAT